jgi:hypothetical protein
MRARSRSDASSRFKGKIAWLRDRRGVDLRRSAIAEDEASSPGSAHAQQLQPNKAHRPRTRSDSKWLKITRKKAVEAAASSDKIMPFEWPPVRWRKAKTKAEPPATVARSQSVAGLTNHEVDKVVTSKLKRHGSDRGQKKSVAFESNSWWNSSMKLLFDMTSGKGGKNKGRRRHLSSDSSN